MATSISCDCNGQFAVLCGPRSISLVNLENPKAVVQTIARNSHLKFCGVQWHPHSFYSSLFLCGSNQYVELWSWDASTLNGTHKTTLKGHTRTINDFDWSIVEPTIVATCSADTNTYLWDIRESRRPSKTLQSVVCPSRVRWSPLSEKSLATTHEGDLKIWDLRKCNTPVQYIVAHDQKVTGMDWSPFNERQLATCSEDGSLKFWSINSQKQEENKIVSNTPFSKVKYMPFGNGVVTSYAPQTGGTLNIWALGRMLSTQSRCQPLCTFNSRDGQGDVIDFCLRIIDNDFQLLSWLSDCSLKVNRINSLIKQYCGNRLLNSLHRASYLYEPTPEQDAVVELDLTEVTPQSNDSVPRHRKTGNCLPPIPTRLDKMSTAIARTLWLEFTLLNITIPDVVVTEMCAETQSLIVRVVKGGHKVNLTMTFPAEYPFKVSPEFFLSDDTTLDQNEKRRLTEDLKSTAVQHVQHGRHCIEPCLWRLIQSLDSIVMGKASQLNPPDTGASYLPMSEIWSPFLTEKLRDENIPFPRISGARFCGQGFLVCFTRRMFLDVPSASIVASEKSRRKRSESGITPRAMSALSEMTQPTRIPSTARMMRGYPVAARSLPLPDRRVPSVSQYYQLQDQKPQKSNSKPGLRDQLLPEEDKTATRNRKCPVGPVIVYDLSCLLPVQKVLGENYVFDRKDLVSMCRRNSQAAAAADRKDLVQVWSLASVQVSQFKGSNSVFGDLSTVWGRHPFGQKLVNLWIDYYSSISDVQTLAMISCTFGSVGNSAAQPSALKTTATAPGCSNNTNNADPFTNGLKTDKDAVGSGQNSFVRKVHQSNSLPEAKIEGVDHSPDAATGERSRFSECADSDDDDTRISLLDSTQSAKCDRFKHAYANILFQWEQVKQRAELLGYLSSCALDENSRFSIEPSSSVNEKDNFSAVLTASVICVLCQLRVKGVVSLCAVCGHGGHTLHMLDWFGSHKSCASGCGCECVYENPSDLRSE